MSNATSPHDWKFTQVFGDKVTSEKVTDEDVISAMCFDRSGDFLSLGDRAGRLIIFERNGTRRSRKGHCEFSYLTELQSHTKEFDFLKSVDVEERVNSIEWLRPDGDKLLVLTANDKSVKLWKAARKVVRRSDKFADRAGMIERGAAALTCPPLRTVDQGYCPSLKRTYANLHGYHINSLSAAADGEKFLTADDLRVNVWDLESSNVAFNVVDRKPDSLEEVSEVITAAKFCPTADAVLAYGTSKGAVTLVDLRVSAKLANTTVFEDTSPTQKRTFFTDIVSSISDVTFSANGKYIFARDFLTVRVWDLANASKPYQTINLFEPLKSKLCEMFERDCIFDKFSIASSPCSDYFVTGMFNNKFHVVDRAGERNTQFDLNFQKKTLSRLIPRNHYEPLSGDYNYEKKVLKSAWNPAANCIAVASANCLFFYNSS